ncbi:hypothetical protein [Streptomyces cavernicola]|uniref:DUF4232 domain-containing protein n=1 Tax=Streptomyces cavernicola TaxID=3043613 RepID=A0ABT6SJG0_9ACTN|nr:hypothetical protein [Streptomyces sp. B-S-A6]MDI3407797.1 hypothetical protein [Streptomyces sp. B-S-A6]
MSRFAHDGHNGHEDKTYDGYDRYDGYENEAQYDQHGGNEAVNSGPHTHGSESTPSERGDASGSEPAGRDSSREPSGADPSVESSAGPSDLGPDELAVRRLLQGAVQQLEPSDQALDHLRRAVPARRARKRQAVVGMAAAALFIGTAVPALVHVTSSPSGNDDHPSAVGHSSEVPGGNDSAKVTGGGEQGGDKPAGKGDEGGKEKGDDGGKGKGSGDTEPGEGSTAGADPTATEAITAVTCDAAQLGSATATAEPPDAEGKVYGTFRVSNTSDAECTVGGAGSVVFAAQGAADPAKINVVDHASGDAATRLPDPAAGPTSIVLGPGMAYEVRFAWVPSESCPGPGASPDPTPTGDGTSGGTEQSGTTTQLGGEEGPSDGSVTVTHTAEPGAPSAATTIAGCAGTIYRTGVLAAS